MEKSSLRRRFNLWNKATDIVHVDNRVGGVMGRFDVSSFNHNYLRQRAAIINRPDWHLASFSFASAYAIEGNGTPGATTDKEHNRKLDAGRPLPRHRSYGTCKVRGTGDNARTCND